MAEVRAAARRVRFLGVLQPYPRAHRPEPGFRAIKSVGKIRANICIQKNAYRRRIGPETGPFRGLVLGWSCLSALIIF
jgi:hypothetical protein